MEKMVTVTIKGDGFDSKYTVFAADFMPLVEGLLADYAKNRTKRTKKVLSDKIKAAKAAKGVK